MNIDDKMFKYIDEVLIDKINKEVYLYTSPKMAYIPDHIDVKGILKYSEVVNYEPIIVENDEVIYIKGPLRIGSGVLLIINDNLVPLQLRDEHVKYYKKMFNDFSGHVNINDTVVDTALKEFYEEVIFIDNKTREPIFMSTENFFGFDTSIYKTSAMIAKESYGIDISVEKVMIVPSQLYKSDDTYNIVVYENRKKINEFEGIVMYDKKTNSIEVTIIIKVELDVNNLSILSLETIGTPVVLFNKENLKHAKFSFLTPRVREVRKIL